MVKKVITDLDSSKASVTNCILVVVLKNCEPELSLKESCLPDCLRVSSMVPVFKNVGKALLLKTAAMLALFLRLVKSLKNL